MNATNVNSKFKTILIYPITSFPRKRESILITHMDPRLREDDVVTSVSLVFSTHP